MEIIAHVHIYRNNSVIMFMHIKINIHTHNVNNNFVNSDLIYVYIQKYFLTTGIDFSILYIYVDFCIHVYPSSTRLQFRSMFSLLIDWLIAEQSRFWLNKTRSHSPFSASRHYHDIDGKVYDNVQILVLVFSKNV